MSLLDDFWEGKFENPEPSAYRASPECAERGCEISKTYDGQGMRSIYQHGENPEAVLFISHLSWANTPSEAAAEAQRRFREWAERIHRYEEGGEVVPANESVLTATGPKP